MKKSQIPDIVEFKGKLLPGKWIKRSGSQKDRNLYCWFYEEGDSFAHVSIDMSDPDNDWTDFHVSYPIKRQQAWSEGLVRESYSVHFSMDKNLDGLKETRRTDVSHWKTNVSDRGWGVMTRQARQVAMEFVGAAFRDGAV